MSRYPLTIDGIQYAPYLEPRNLMDQDDVDLLLKRKKLLEELGKLTDDEEEKSNGAAENGCSRRKRKRDDEVQAPASPSSGGFRSSPDEESDREWFDEDSQDRTEPMNGNSNSTLDESFEKVIVDELENNIELPQYKTVLENLENDYFETLPPGWTRITHNSGMPVYLHRESRVVCFARPYYIGTDSVRRHSVPVSAIPCLHQLRISEKEKIKKEPEQSHENPLIKNIQSSGISIERFEDSRIGPTEITDYAKGRFKFKQIPIRRYKSFKERKEEKHELKTQQALREAGLSNEDLKIDDTATIAPSGLALINIQTLDNRFHKKNLVMNPTGRSSVSILHEYAQRALKGRIAYDINETLNAPLPYTATVKLFLKKEIRVQLVTGIKDKLEILQSRTEDGMADNEDQLILGSGQGTSKKNAKLVAAEVAVKLLIPSIQFDRDHTASLDVNGPSQVNYDSKAIEIFDKIEVTDMRVADLCGKSTLPKPYTILMEACNRNTNLQGSIPEHTSKQVDGRQTEVTMTVRGLSVTVVGNGQKQAKQLAAQHLLKQIHPKVDYYGTILRMYANPHEKQTRKENSRTREEVINLQNKGPLHQPNKAILQKLREEMMSINRAAMIRPSIMYTRPQPAVNPFLHLLNNQNGSPI